MHQVVPSLLVSVHRQVQELLECRIEIVQMYRKVGRILRAPGTVLATARQASVAITACWTIPKNISFIVLTVDAYVREMDIL